jgi:ABC-type transporter Mla subunit MlaD
MESRDSTLKVGLIITVAVIMGVLGYVVLQDVFYQGGTEIYYADFDTAQGAMEGSPVKMRGNVIGKVVRLDLLSQGSRATMRIKRVYKGNPVRLYPEFVLVINQDDLFGEKYLEIQDPIADRPIGGDVVPPEHVFEGRNRAGLANLLAGAFTDTLDDAGISDVLEEVITVMGSETLQSSLGRFEETLTNVNALVLSVSEMVTGSEGYVTGSLANVYAMSENFKSMSEDLQAISGELSGMAKDPEEHQRWEEIFANIEQTTANLNELSASLGELVGDEELQADFRDSVRLTKETLEETKETVVRFQDTLDKVDETLESADSLMDTAEGTVVEAKDKLDKLSRVGDAVEIKMSLNVRAVDLNDDQALDNEDYYVGDLNAAVGYEDTYVYFGADEIGEENNFNLMMGYGSLAGLSFRGGVYRGELGLGAAYYGDLGAEVTWYDTEDPKVNAYGYIPIAEKLNLVVGGEDIGNDPVASVGVGVELQ